MSFFLNLSLFVFILSLKTTNGFAETKSHKNQKIISFNEIIPLAFKNDKKLSIILNNKKSALLDFKSSKSSIYPKLDVTVSVAEQDDSNPNSANENFSPREYKLKISQNLWDFGESATKISISEIKVQQAEINILEAKKNVILKAARAYSIYRKTRAQYFLSKEFERKLKKQTGMQDYKIKQGASISSDLLQAKNALAKATTSKAIKYGNLKSSEITFKSTFDFVPSLKTKLLPIQIPFNLIPQNLKEYSELVLNKGFQGRRAFLNRKLSISTSEDAFSQNFLPKFTLIGEVNHKDNHSGTLGFLTENIIKVEMKWPLELFGTQIHKYRSSQLKYKNSLIIYDESIKSIIENSKRAWIRYKNEKMNLEYIENQVNIAKEFLKMSNLEFKDGRGNMNTIINAQNALYNSQNLYKETRANFALAIYSLISDTGKLTLANIKLS